MSFPAAVAAKLPTCLGVHGPGGAPPVRPDLWVTAAGIAMGGEFPVPVRMGVAIEAFDEPPATLPITVAAIGLAAFNGHEIVMPRMRMPWTEAITMPGARADAAGRRSRLSRR
ncbi:MAG: hypothetical protein ACK4KW_05410 [Gemmobacter sp.]